MKRISLRVPGKVANAGPFKLLESMLIIDYIPYTVAMSPGSNITSDQNHENVWISLNQTKCALTLQDRRPLTSANPESRARTLPFLCTLSAPPLQITTSTTAGISLVVGFTAYRARDHIPKLKTWRVESSLF